MDEPQYYKVLECVSETYRGGKYSCCKTDSSHKIPNPTTLGDWWTLSQEKFDELTKNGYITNIQLL